eukprot:gene3538-2489_t
MQTQTAQPHKYTSASNPTTIQVSHVHVICHLTIKPPFCNHNMQVNLHSYNILRHTKITHKSPINTQVLLITREILNNSTNSKHRNRCTNHTHNCNYKHAKSIRKQLSDTNPQITTYKDTYNLIHKAKAPQQTQPSKQSKPAHQIHHKRTHMQVHKHPQGNSNYAHLRANPSAVNSYSNIIITPHVSPDNRVSNKPLHNNSHSYPHKVEQTHPTTYNLYTEHSVVIAKSDIKLNN